MLRTFTCAPGYSVHVIYDSLIRVPHPPGSLLEWTPSPSLLHDLHRECPRWPRATAPAYRPPKTGDQGLGQGMGRGLESSLDPQKTTARLTSRGNIGLSPELGRALVACLPPAARIFLLSPLHYRFGVAVLADRLPKSGQPALTPCGLAYRRGRAPLTAPGNECARNWLMGSLPRRHSDVGTIRTGLKKKAANGLPWPI